MNLMKHMLARAAAPLAIAAGLALAPSLATASAQTPAAPEQETAGIIVTLDSQASRQLNGHSGEDALSLLADTDVMRSLEDAGLSVEGARTDAEGAALITAKPSEDMSDAEALARARSISGVAAVQYNYVYHLIDSEEVTAPAAQTDNAASTLAAAPVNDPFTQREDYDENYNQYWAYDTGLVNVWQGAPDSSSVTVAVVDSGVLLDHEDLKDNVLTDLAYDAVTGTPLAEANEQDRDGHGTNVAGVVAARANNATGLAGASLNAKILPVKIMRDEDKYIDSNYLIAAYTYLDKLVESNQVDDLRVINMSVGGYGDSANDEAFHKLIQHMLDEHNVITVCAGGNKGVDKDKTTPGTDPIFPSDFEECVSVTALEPTGENIAGFDYNAAKDISAPGNYIWSTYHTPGNAATDEYTMQCGSSEASPIVAGTIALMCALEPDATPEQILGALYSTATPVDNTDLEANGSHGALDADAALAYLQDCIDGEPEPDPEPVPLPFADVAEGDWYFDAVSFVYERQIMGGYGDGVFGPNNPLLREQLAKLLYEYLGNGTQASPAQLADVDQSQYYAAAVNWAVENQVLSGYGEPGDATARFGVGDALTREQLAIVIARLAGADTLQADPAKFNALPDSARTNSWARSSMIWAVDQGIISGRETEGGSRLLDPQGVCTRAEMAQVITSCIQTGIL